MNQTHKTLNARAREVTRFAHVNMRLRERYKFEIDMDEYQQLCDLFRQQRFIEANPSSTGDIEGLVEFKGEPIWALYKPREGLIATVLPVPNGFREFYLQKKKKKLEENASRQSEVEQKHEVDPVTMRNEKLRSAALRTKVLIEQRKQEEILNLFMEISKMRPNVNVRNHQKDWRHPSTEKVG